MDKEPENITEEKIPAPDAAPVEKKYTNEEREAIMKSIFAKLDEEDQRFIIDTIFKREQAIRYNLLIGFSITRLKMSKRVEHMLEAFFPPVNKKLIKDISAYVDKGIIE